MSEVGATDADGGDEEFVLGTTGGTVAELLKRLCSSTIGGAKDIASLGNATTASVFDPLRPIGTPTALPGILQHAITSCSVDEQVELLSMLIVSAAHSKINREYITRYVSFDKLLSMEQSAISASGGDAKVITMKVFQLVHLLGSHSISVKVSYLLKNLEISLLERW